MYDHEYEWQILGFLRMLKYIWQRNKSILATSCVIIVVARSTPRTYLSYP